jgi:hypothetical protein
VPRATDDAFIEASTSIVGSAASAKLVSLNATLEMGDAAALITTSNLDRDQYVDGGRDHRAREFAGG